MHYIQGFLGDEFFDIVKEYINPKDCEEYIQSYEDEFKDYKQRIEGLESDLSEIKDILKQLKYDSEIEDDNVVETLSHIFSVIYY